MSGRTLSVRNVGANIVINSDPCKNYGYKGRAELPTELSVIYTFATAKGSTFALQNINDRKI